MVTGYNTDVAHDERVFHVQTEDRGRNHPVIDSVIYCGGEIVASRRTPYGERLADPAFGDEAIQQLLDEQHARVIREVRNGHYDTGGMRPFGHSIVTNRSFDEVVATALIEAIPLAAIQLKLTGPRVLRERTRATLRLEVREKTSERPICGATVIVELRTTPERTGRALLNAPTDERGRVEAVLNLPALGGTEGTLVFRADAAGSVAEIERQVQVARPRTIATVDEV